MPAIGHRKPIEFIETASGCFECTSHYKDRYGYACAFWNNKHVLLHRHVYEENYGTIPDGLVVRHKCDNPSCINPAHLEIGTHAENSQDKVDRQRSPAKERNGNAKLSQEQVDEIKNSTLSYAEIQEKYGISRGHVYRVKHGVSWK